MFAGMDAHSPIMLHAALTTMRRNSEKGRDGSNRGQEHCQQSKDLHVVMTTENNATWCVCANNVVSNRLNVLLWPLS